MYPRLLVPPERLNTKKKPKKTSFPLLWLLFYFFLIANKRYFNSCQDDNGCPNVLFDVFEPREQVGEKEWYRGRDTGGKQNINGNKRAGESE